MRLGREYHENAIAQSLIDEGMSPEAAKKAAKDWVDYLLETVERVKRQREAVNET